MHSLLGSPLCTPAIACIPSITRNSLPPSFQMGNLKFRAIRESYRIIDSSISTLKGLRFEKAAMKGPEETDGLGGTCSIPGGPSLGPGGNHHLTALFSGCIEDALRHLSWGGEKPERDVGGGLFLLPLSRGARGAP